MNNAVLPPLSSEIYNSGDNEIQMPISEFSMDSKVSGYGSTSYLESNQLRNDDFAIPYQHYQSGYYQFTPCNRDNNEQKSILPQDLDFKATTTRKRSIHVACPLQQGAITMNKRRNTTSLEEQWHQKVKKATSIKEHKEKMHVPVRRSQKLGDKITALQKLVSPFGKTDTASVLEEASFYIKLLQRQIQNLFQMLSRSCPSQKNDGKLLDLQSRGLCLIPISVVQKLSQEHDFVA